jgi:hypothetical protein
MDAITKAIEALETAESGLRWYIDMCPQFARECDDEALAEIDVALSALRAQQDTKDGEASKHFTMYYTADQLLQAVREERERCAQACEAVAFKDCHEWRRDAVEKCVAAIRAMPGGEK